MSMVQTVLGPLPAGDLGLTVSHEHLLCRPPGSVGDSDPDLALDDQEAAVSELSGFKAAGGNALVEVTPLDYGRDLDGLVTLSRRTGVHVVAATGLHKDQFSAPYTARFDEDQLADTFMRELQFGVNGVRAGVIKLGSSLEQITPGERKAFTAAALAQRATGAPITTHTEAGRLAMEQLELLIGAGADPERIIIGHLDRLLDSDYHEAVLRTGAYVGYDQIGKPKYATDERRAAALAILVARGHGAKLLISGDLGRKSYWKAYGGTPGLDYIPKTFLSMLCAAGLTAGQAEALVVGNPARAFG
jgi:predicted metal-dependent phosphotriesterase family hydrolase